jgi:hypothetical protein
MAGLKDVVLKGGTSRKMFKKVRVYAGDGGWGGIRTHGTLAGTPVFKTGALNRSATHPSLSYISIYSSPLVRI